MKLAVLIVNFRRPDLTIQCLASVVPQLRSIGKARAIVLENGSNDGSDRVIRRAINRENWQDVVDLICSKENLGFARGNNLAFRRAADADYYLLLNCDTVVNDGCVSYCLRQMTHTPSIGAMSCRLNHPDGTPQATARKFPTPLTEIFNATHLSHHLPRLFGWADTADPGWDRATTVRDVQWIMGAFMFLRGDLVRRINLFDEDFFLFGEDLELCHRIRRAGYRIRYDPAVSIVHFIGKSSGPDQISPSRRDALFLEARYLAARKLYGPFGAGFMRCCDTLARVARQLLSRVRRRG